MNKLTSALLAGSLLAFGACNQSELDTAMPMHEAPAASLPSPSTLNLFYVTGTPPSTPAGDALQWTLERVNLGPEATTLDDITAHFDTAVLEEASAQAISDQIALVGRDRPYAFVGYVNEPTATAMETLIMSRHGFRTLRIETVEGGRLKVLMFDRADVPLAADNARAPEGWTLAPAPAAVPAAPAVDPTAAPADPSAAVADPTAAPAAGLPAVQEVGEGAVPANAPTE